MNSTVNGSILDSLRMKSVGSRNASFVNSSELSDVKFKFKNLSGLVGTNGDGQGGETIIYGHKLILAMASPVFRKMFYIDKINLRFVTAVTDEIPMDDCGFNAEAFLEFIRYDVPALKKVCEDQLGQIMTIENVIRILETAETFRGRDLADDALGFIDRNLGSLVESGEIFCIKLETLFEILKRDSLDVDESLILDLALKWAGEECERKNREPTAENKREVLGKAFFEIRFRLLTSARMSELISSNLLTRDESLDIVLEFHNPGYVTTVDNPKSKRLRLAPEVGFKSSPRIFGKKKKLIEEDEMEEEWKEKNNFHSLRALAMSSTDDLKEADLIMSGFPRNKTPKELKDQIEIVRSVSDSNVYVHKMGRNDGAFHVQFYYNATECRLSNLLDPAWYQFDNPRSIQISITDFGIESDESDDDD